jgi:hypothetical protein
MKQDFATGTALCTFSGELAVYRLWHGQRHCFDCGEDHES